MPSRQRQDFIDTVGYFTHVIDQVEPDQWSQPVGNQTLLEVAASGSRPLSTTRDFLLAGATRIDHADVISYYVGPRPDDPNRAEAAAQRGREALERLQSGDPGETIQALADSVLEVVAGADDDALVGTTNGALRLVDYLPTRSLELLVYGLDIAEAISSSIEPPSDAVASSAQLLTDINLARGRGVRLCRVVWREVGHS